MEKILITAALPYANGAIHFGHIAGAYLPADVYARFQRLIGNDALFICGSDEFGIAITMSAEKEGKTYQEHVDFYHTINKELFDKLNIGFDHYSRTTWSGHIPVVQAFFQDLLKNGYIEEKTEKHLFSEEENRFLADRYVVGACPKCGFEKARGDECPKCGASYEAKDLKNPKSKVSGSNLVLKPSKHWYLRFDKFKEKLSAWTEKKNWKPNVINFAKEYINDLKPRGITRDSTWGVPIPLKEADGKVFYVWFDAPIGYISATKEWAEKIKKPNEWEKYWLDPKTRLVNFIGKDNIPFHTVFFPAMVMGQNTPYKLVDDVPANEFLMLEGRQFSKSDGWYIDLADFLTKYSVDQIRYTLAANAPENQDAEFSWKDFQNKCNGDLLGKLGNFVNRVLVFAKNNFLNEVPLAKNLKEIDEKFLQDIADCKEEIKKAYSHYQLRRAAQVMIELAQKGNIYFDHKKPWSLIKNKEAQDAANTIACCLHCIKALAVVSWPIIPDTADSIFKMLGYGKKVADFTFDAIIKQKLKAGSKLHEAKILFRKIEDEEIKKETERLNYMHKEENLPAVTSYKPLKAQVSYEDFDKLDFRVGKILKAEPVPNSKKLLKLEIDLGFEKRQVVSGIAHQIDISILVGKKVVLLANLKPAKLMGIESQGMIIVAGSEKIELLSVSNTDIGDVVS